MPSGKHKKLEVTKMDSRLQDAHVQQDPWRQWRHSENWCAHGQRSQAENGRVWSDWKESWRWYGEGGWEETWWEDHGWQNRDSQAAGCGWMCSGETWTHGRKNSASDVEKKAVEDGSGDTSHQIDTVESNMHDSNHSNYAKQLIAFPGEDNDADVQLISAQKSILLGLLRECKGGQRDSFNALVCTEDILSIEEKDRKFCVGVDKEYKTFRAKVSLHPDFRVDDNIHSDWQCSKEQAIKEAIANAKNALHAAGQFRTYSSGSGRCRWFGDISKSLSATGHSYYEDQRTGA